MFSSHPAEWRQLRRRWVRLFLQPWAHSLHTCCGSAICREAPNTVFTSISLNYTMRNPRLLMIDYIQHICFSYCVGRGVIRLREWFLSSESLFLRVKFPFNDKLWNFLIKFCPTTDWKRLLSKIVDGMSWFVSNTRSSV